MYVVYIVLSIWNMDIWLYWVTKITDLQYWRWRKNRTEQNRTVARIKSCHAIIPTEDFPYSYNLCWTWMLRMRIEIVMKETCQNLVRSVVQREDLQIEKENTGKEKRMLNWIIWAGYGLETSVIVGMSSDQFYEWKPTLKWRKYFWTGNR